MKRTKRYDADLKKQAVDMAREGSKSVLQIARDLDINANTLYSWLDKYRKANPEENPVKMINDKPVELEAEVKRLKRELNRALEDVDPMTGSGLAFCFFNNHYRISYRVA